MLAFLQARRPGPGGEPEAAKVAAFSAANPETLHQADYIATSSLPGSFAGTTYWGVHAFPATNSQDETRLWLNHAGVPRWQERWRGKSAPPPHEFRKQSFRSLKGPRHFGVTSTRRDSQGPAHSSKIAGHPVPQ